MIVKVLGLLLMGRGFATTTWLASGGKSDREVHKKMSKFVIRSVNQNGIYTLSLET